MLRRLSDTVALAALLALAGCHSAQSTYNAHGPAARRIGDLSMLMTVLFVVISVIMWALIGYAAVRRRGSLKEHAPIDMGGGEGWIAIGGILVPLVILTLIFVLGLGLLRDFPIHGMHGASHQAQMSQSMKPEIRIIGHQWWWEIEYLNDDVSKEFTTANELHLPVGRPVNIEVETHDVMHSFWVPALHGKVDLIPPDLTHIGGREMIAANNYMNNDAYLEAWVTHAQSLKPGAQMPDLTSFSGEQLHQLVAYLRQLQ